MPSHLRSGKEIVERGLVRKHTTTKLGHMFECFQTQYEKAFYSSGILNNVKIKLTEAKIS